MYTHPTYAQRWNTRLAGKPALHCVNSQGYRVGAIHGHMVYAHRIIWKMIYGYDPVGIDHEDGNTTNNLLQNMREANQQVNSQNLSKSIRNKSGHTGVYWKAARKKWVAQITVNKRKIVLGSFDDIQQAIAARNQASLQYGFHVNHGR